MTAWPWSLCVACALLAGCAGGPDEPEKLAQPDIVLITVDTLRADHLGLYGYERATSPNLDRWFADGAIYERSYSAHAATSQSITSVLSGLLPTEHGVRMHYQLVRDDLPLIPDMLGPDYQTAGFISNMVLTDEAMGLGSRFDHYDDFVDEKEPNRVVWERNAARTTDAALIWLLEHRDPERPLFLWLHYIDPHGPYRPPEDWPRSFSHEGSVEIDLERLRKYQREEGQIDGLYYVDAYDEEIAYTDSEIQRFLSAYADMHSIDDTLLIFTADHGESMMEHEEWFTHSYHVYDEITRVPLMLRGPGVEPGRRDRLVSGIDIAPTILNHAGRRVPGNMSGVDLRTGKGGDEQRTVFLEARGYQHHHAGVAGGDKWIVTVNPDSTEIVSRIHFDLESDPGELQPGSWGDDPTSAAVERLCVDDPDRAGVPESVRRGQRLKTPKIDPRASPEALEKLRSLGYVQ